MKTPKSTFWPDSLLTRRGRRIIFKLSEFEAWCLTLRLRRLDADGLRFVAAAITAAELEMVRGGAAPAFGTPDQSPTP